MQLNYANIAKLLSHGEPQAYAMREDGTMVVIVEDGKKLLFTPQEVKEAELLNKPPASTPPATSSQPRATSHKPRAKKS